jgi:HSP20 family protein
MSKLNVKTLSSSTDRSLPIFGEIDELANRIRGRAYELFTDRKSGADRDLDDWILAEREYGLPAAKLVERADDLELDVALAGFAPDEIKLTATPHELIIKAAHVVKHEKKPTKADETIHWNEFRRNEVCRRIELPQEVDVKKVSAEFENGLLKIVAPKVTDKGQPAKPVKISAPKKK